MNAYQSYICNFIYEYYVLLYVTLNPMLAKHYRWESLETEN